MSGESPYRLHLNDAGDLLIRVPEPSRRGAWLGVEIPAATVASFKADVAALGAVPQAPDSGGRLRERDVQRAVDAFSAKRVQGHTIEASIRAALAAAGRGDSPAPDTIDVSVQTSDVAAVLARLDENDPEAAQVLRDYRAEVVRRSPAPADGGERQEGGDVHTDRCHSPICPCFRDGRDSIPAAPGAQADDLLALVREWGSKADEPLRPVVARDAYVGCAAALASALNARRAAGGSPAPAAPGDERVEEIRRHMETTRVATPVTKDDAWALLAAYDALRAAAAGSVPTDDPAGAPEGER